MEDKVDAEIDDQIVGMTEQQKDHWLAIFGGLSASPKFKEFVALNFDIQNVVDDEKKTLEVRVIEKPGAIIPKPTPNQIFKLHKTLISNGVKAERATECTNQVLTILGQPVSSGSLVASATDADLKRVLDKSKLD
jgi:hypothetical protein